MARYSQDSQWEDDEKLERQADGCLLGPFNITTASTNMPARELFIFNSLGTLPLFDFLMTIH